MKNYEKVRESYTKEGKKIECKRREGRMVIGKLESRLDLLVQKQKRRIKIR